MTISRVKLASVLLIGALTGSSVTAYAQNTVDPSPAVSTTATIPVQAPVPAAPLAGERDASFLPPSTSAPAVPAVTPPPSNAAVPNAAPVVLAPTATIAAPLPVTAATPAVASVPTIVSPPVAPSPMPPLDLGKPVEASALSDINPESIGLLSASEGGFGAAMWKGTPRLLVERLLPALNLPTASPTLNNVAQRFLLTTASVPTGTAESKQSLVSMRLERLVALGDVKDAWNLAMKSQPDQIDEITLRQVVEAALVSSASADVCTKLPNIMKMHTGIEWQKSLLVCQLRANDTKAAQLSLDVLHTQNIKDETFFALAEKNLIGNSKQLPRRLTPLTPLTLALLRLTNLPLPSEVYAHADASLAPELLQAPSREDAARISLAERMAERGLLSGDDLAAVYHNTVFAPEALSNVLSSPETGPRLHALLYQVAMAEQTPQKKLDDITKFIQTSNASLINGAGAAVLLHMLGNVQPGPDFYTPSVLITRLYMLAGKPETALEWLKLARRGAIGMPPVAAELQDMWPLLVLSGLESDADYGGHLTQWLDAMLKPADPKADNRAQREQAASVLALLEATGFVVPDNDWAEVMDAPTFEKRATSTAVLPERLHAASVGNRRGETLMLSLLLDDGSVVGSLSGTSLETIRILHAIGLTADAATRAREVAFGLMSPVIVKP